MSEKPKDPKLNPEGKEKQPIEPEVRSDNYVTSYDVVLGEKDKGEMKKWMHKKY